MTIEDPVTTVIRLLQRMRVIKDDGSLANIDVTREWFNRELLKNYDGQVTVGLFDTVDQILNIGAKNRRRVSRLRVNVWTFDRSMRKKIVEAVNDVIRSNFNKPNEPWYDFVGLGRGDGPHVAYAGGGPGEEAPDHPDWAEISSSQYKQIWYSDDDRFAFSGKTVGEILQMLFKFKIDAKRTCVEKVVLLFEGYASTENVTREGVTIKVWNHNTEAYDHAVVGEEVAEDRTLKITLTENLDNYIDEDGHIYLFARPTHTNDGTNYTTFACDYVSCTITVNGISYCDVASYRDEDKVDVKPYIWRTEFVLKSWVFQILPG